MFHCRLKARKNVNAPVSRKLRLAKEEGEVYAKITNIYGNGMAEVLCQDGVKRLLVLRRKFKGRNKKDNFISIDGVVLVGRRLWEVVSDKKKQKVDAKAVNNQTYNILQLNKKSLKGSFICFTKEMPMKQIQ